ncbi:MAG: hypothetical protein V4722_04535 [Bacteroidota bacterium]
MTKGERLHKIVKCCEIRFNRGDAATWKHGDYVDLNREIQRDANTNISPSTLKRIFGKVAVEDDYIPQQATVDALKTYGKYVEPEIPQLVPPPLAQPGPPDRTNKFNRSRMLPIMLAVIALGAAVLTWRFLKPKSISGKISITRIEGHLPATAFFELQLPETSDSLFVNFGDKSPWIYVVPGEKKAAHIYYIPGVFTVSIQTRLQAFATTTAYIRSDNWIAFGCHRQDDIPVHFYAFPADRTGSDSLFKFTNNQLSKLGLDTTGPILTRLNNYTPVAHNSDDFVFEATFKNALPEKAFIAGVHNFKFQAAIV